jgi:hypothetical protein
MVMHKVDARMEAGDKPAQRIIQEMGELVGESLKSGVFKDGAGLHPSSKRARLVIAGGKRTVTKGPYAGGNELLASFVMIRATSLDHAIELASRVTGDLEIEIGLVVEPWDLGVAPRPADAPKRYLVLCKADRTFEASGAVPAAWKQLVEQLTSDGIVQSSATLLPSHQGHRLDKKRTWTDGPFAESKELVAGFSIVELPSLAEVKQWTERYGGILGDNEVDVRPVA